LLARKDGLDGVISVARRIVFDAGKVRNLRFDLSNEDGVAGAVDGIREEIGEGVLAVLVNNVGSLVMDGKCNNDPSTEEAMRFTNAIGHAKLTRGLLDKIAKDGRVVEIGSLAKPDGLPFPGIVKYMMTKAHPAIDEVRAMVGERFGIVHPGFAGTEMGAAAIRKVLKGEEPRFPLEWLTLPPTDPSVIARAVDRVISGRVELSGSPRIASVYVGLPRLVQEAFMLPFILMNGRSGLDYFGISLEQHDEHVMRHRDDQTYGRFFPYNAITSDKLWDPSLGRFMMSGMSGIGLF